MTTSVLGGAKVGNGLTISSEKLAVLKDPNGPVVVSSNGVSVQDATTGQKGVVKIGSGLSVSGGVVSADAQTPTAGTLISVSGRQVSVKNSFNGSAPFVGFDATKGELVPAQSSPSGFKFPNYSSKQEEKIVLVSDNSETPDFVNGRMYTYDGMAFTCVKNGQWRSYKDITPTVDSLIMVMLTRSNSAPASNMKLAGLNFMFKSESESSFSNIFNYHPHDENAYNSVILWYRGCIFQGNFKAGSTFRIELAEETGVNLQTPPFLIIAKFPLY